MKKEHDSSFKKGPVSLFEFDEDEPVIQLQLPEDSLSGWTMNHENNAEVNICVQDMWIHLILRYYVHE